MTVDVHIVWFKRDLRIVDHEPIVRAAERGPVVPLYVYEPELLAQPTADARHVEFTNQCLTELDAALRRAGTPLVVRTGRVPDVFDELARELGDDHSIASISAHQETTDLAGYRRDDDVRAWARQRDIDFVEYVDRGVIRRLKTRDGWAKRWKETMSQPLLDEPAALTGTQLRPGELSQPAQLGMSPSVCVEMQCGGRAAGLDTLDSFLTERGKPYTTAMSSPVTAFEHSSRISPHLAFGTVSGREVYQATMQRIAEVRDDPQRGTWLQSLRSFEKRLHWRDHFTQKLEDQPTLEVEAMHPMLDGLRPDFDAVKFERFCEGRTGYPMVDACMRATTATGWLNFRMRAMVVSFATYHLWLDWRPVAAHLARMWTDYEPGIHYPQHQMQSGSSGINTLRIYSPTKQVTDHDPTGVFIKQWVPELRDVPDRHLAEPHLAEPDLFSDGATSSYPPPIVDHTLATRAARDLISEIRKLPEAVAIADEIVQRHGSRKPAPRRPKAKK